MELIKYLKSQKGYTLLLAFVLIILFSILGLSLLALTSSGISKNEVRQDKTRALAQADKGLDFALADINSKLDAYIKAEIGGLTQANFSNKLDNTLKSYFCNQNNTSFGTTAQTATGEFKVCIQPFSLGKENNVDYPIKRTVTFKSKGISGIKWEIVTAQVIIGANAIPEQLKYAVSTNEDGNLFLHGGIDVKGDMKIDGNIIISQKAHWLQNSQNESSVVWQDSTFAKIIPPSADIERSKIFMRSDRDIYLAKTGYTTITKYEGCKKVWLITWTDPTVPKDKCSEKDQVYSSKSQVFDYPKHINYNFSENYINPSDYTIKDKYNFSQYEKVFHKNVPKVIVEKDRREDDNIDITQKIIDAKNNPKYQKNTENKTVSSLSVPTNKEALHVKSNVSISGSGKVIEGLYFLEGNLTINNTSLTTDAILYVDGDVNITNSTINGMEIDKKTTGKFIIFSNGNISISNISVDDDKPSKIQGFFYSKKNFIMYGVGSNIKILGGISAKRTILTAVRGSTKKGYLSETLQENETSRLQIVYDNGLIDGFVKLNRETEDKVKVLAEPVIQSRTY